MSFDLQIVRALSYLPVSALRVVPAAEPPLLEILGGPFDGVEEVHINDQVSPSFVLPTPNKIVAQIPQPASQYEVSVLSPSVFLTDRAAYQFTLGRQPRLITGFPKLIQTFIRVLLQTPGTSILNPEMGGGLRAKLKNTLTAEEVRDLRAEAHLSVKKAANDILVAQARQNLPRDEKLALAEVRSCYTDPTTRKLYLGVDLRNQAGTRGNPLLQLLVRLDAKSRHCHTTTMNNAQRTPELSVAWRLCDIERMLDNHQILDPGDRDFLSSLLNSSLQDRSLKALQRAA